MTRHERIVTDEDLEKALDWLRDSAQAMGDAKAEMVKATEQFTPVLQKSEAT